MKHYLSYSLAGVALLANAAYAGGMEGYGVPDNMTFYGGASIGGVNQDGACDVVDNTHDCKKPNNGYKVFAGTRFAPMYDAQTLPSVGAEMGYIDFGESTSQGEILSERGFSLGDANVSNNVSSTYLAGVGYLPVAPNTELIGKAGLALWQQDGKVAVPEDSALNSNSTNSGLGTLLGAGAQYRVNDNLSVRGEYEQVFDTAKDTSYKTDASLYSVGAVFSTY
ncbi:MAG: hypothetical protein RI964_49 [Pseudomonadota bacterium]|jgi:opacity protein-like surface antigen